MKVVVPAQSAAYSSKKLIFFCRCKLHQRSAVSRGARPVFTPGRFTVSLLSAFFVVLTVSCGGGDGSGAVTDNEGALQVPDTGAALAESPGLVVGEPQTTPTSTSESNANTDQTANLAEPRPLEMPDGPVDNVLSILSDEEFELLAPFEQYRVANKFLSTQFDGLPLVDFFDLDTGLTEPESLGVFVPSKVLALMSTALESSERLALDSQILGSDIIDLPDEAPTEGRFWFSDKRAQELPLARLYTYPLSRDKSSLWMAWHLANTILFSPATELESVGMTDVQNILRRLDSAIHNDVPITEVVIQHMRSLENWRRFRSPEDNTREMLEIFLGLEELDDQVPAASAACGDWYLTDESDGYQLSYTDYPNNEAQTVLQQTIVTCDDFYHVVAHHELLIPTLARTLVSYFFSSRSHEFQARAVEQLVGQQPVTFRDLFIPIIFSRSYLLDTEKVMAYEELFLGAAKRINWRSRDDMFTGLVSGRGGMTRSFMGEMSWPTMSGKIGRRNIVPTDSLSFANYHKGFREDLVMRPWRWVRGLGVEQPETPDPAPLKAPPQDATAQAIEDYQTVVANNKEIIDAMSAAERAAYDQDLRTYLLQLELHEKVKKFSLPEFVDYLFLSLATRRANAIETQSLIGLFDAKGYLRIEEEGAYLNKWSRVQAAVLVMDYLTRLPETYYHRKLDWEGSLSQSRQRGE